MIETERLVLREMCDADYDALYAVLADPDIMRHYPYTFDGARVGKWISTNIERYRVFGFGLWAVCLKDTGEMIGDCGLSVQNVNGFFRPEIGYHLRRDCQRKGYAKEAASAVMDWTFENTGFGCVYSFMKAANAASSATARSVGMRKTDEYTDGENELTEVYGITRDEWSALRGGLSGIEPGRVTIRPETPADYKEIVSLVLRSFREGTDYSDGTDIVALIEEIRGSEFYIPELSFVAELDGRIVGHFLFSRFPLSATPQGGHGGAGGTDVVMLAPVSVHADCLRRGIGSAMLRLGIEKVREAGLAGIIVEGNYLFYNTLGFRTSSEYGIYPVSGYPMTEPRCQMCMETRAGSLNGAGGYVVYDMYRNA